jgi:hypothetical protein
MRGKGTALPRYGEERVERARDQSVRHKRCLACTQHIGHVGEMCVTERHIHVERNGMESKTDHRRWRQVCPPHVAP